MAEFQEVMRQWRRMCADGSIGYACAECKMYSSIDESICRGIPSEDDAKNIERFVMSWAAEHPEPVYPTWAEWLVDSGVFPQKMSTIPSVAFNTIRDSLSVRIPADIARKLGVEPKEFDRGT